MKKLLTGLFVLITSITTIACQTELPVSGEGLNDLYLYQAISGIDLLIDYSYSSDNVQVDAEVSPSTTNTPIITGNENSAIKHYLPMVQHLLNYQDSLITEVVSSDDNMYQNKMILISKNLSQQNEVYQLYYNNVTLGDVLNNETSSTTTTNTTIDNTTTTIESNTIPTTTIDAEASPSNFSQFIPNQVISSTNPFSFDDDIPDYVMFSLNGKVLKDDQTYLFEAKQVLSETETYYKLRVYIDTENYITICFQQETNTVQTMYFEVTENLVVINQSRLQIETNGTISNVELISYDNQIVSSYQLSYNHETPSQPILIEYQYMENDFLIDSGNFTLTPTLNSASNQIEYNINTPSSNHEDDDDDDYEDEHEDDENEHEDDDDEYEDDDDEYEDD